MFNRGSLSDPARWTPNWNHTFELTTDTPKAGILLLHGMSDSPYSISNLGRRLHSAGAWVIGLRIPGHGTAPAGLTQVKWEDMSAAVLLAMRHLSTKAGKQPLYLVGYSNGATLAVHYALSAPAVVDGLFRKLPVNAHELVLLDINRRSGIEHVLKKDPKSGYEAVFNDPDRPFTISLITNASQESRDVVLLQKKPGESKISRKPLNMTWPPHIYSLAHVALPFPMSDPLYGILDSKDSSRIRLGNVALRGERGVLQISASEMLRLRCNPFYPYMERRLLEFVGLASPDHSFKN